jgi:hypothetical protein
MVESQISGTEKKRTDAVMQWHGNHISVAANEHKTTQEL